MRSVSSPAIIATPAFLALVALGLLLFPSCSGKPVNPSGPDSAGLYLGTWTGPIISEAAGRGSITIVIDSQVGPPLSPLLSGGWELTFADGLFRSQGLMAANFSAGRTTLELFFDRGPLPCPGEPDGFAQRAMIASLTVSVDRMTGTYIVGGCPGGSMELLRR